MLIIKIKEGENIDRALKRYRKKYKNTKLIQEVRRRKEYKKESVRRREEVQKAQYKERMFNTDN
ncbi:30S ribosomal protein S21 [Tenacibaculum sp. M341]|uniref:30S ribosomal protein S21 n=1 Tax=Tenacibaculum sp. M341 TaxID=2530339 RepID=UPI00104D068A|nr:30S ribosomal protein S21 [Tenacibaculum sp. M341]TCI94777.1 30S ribosomal protein S21 [Tenacibaculum sp. M341]